MGNKELENLTLCEIRVMLAAGDIALQDLDTAMLEKLMDREIDLLCIDEGDTDFISKCAELLCERKPETMSHGRFAAVIHETFEKHVTIAPKRLRIKKVLIIAAAIATLIIGGTVVASALGFNLFDYINKTAMSTSGSKFDEGDYTFFTPGESREYTTLKEAVEKENLNIMYPASLPEGIEVKGVKVTNGHRGGKWIEVITEDDSVSISIETGVVLADDAIDIKELYMQDGIGYSIHKPTTYKYGANAYVDNCQYVIQANRYEDLIYIIENMEDNKNEENS